MITPEVGKRYYYRPYGADINDVVVGKVVATCEGGRTFLTKYCGKLREFDSNHIVARCPRRRWWFW